MRASCVTTSILLTPLLGLITTSAHAEQRSWGADPGRNMVKEAQNLPIHFTEENLRWEVDSGTSHHYPMPAIVGDKIFIAGNVRGAPEPLPRSAMRRGSSLVCRSLSDGSEHWRLISGGNGRGDGFGVCGSPVVIGDEVYVLAQEDLYCLDVNGMADGNQGSQNELEYMTDSGWRGPKPDALPEWAADVIWRYSFRDMNIRVQDAISATPLVLEDQIWISTANEMGSEARGDWNRKTETWDKHEPKPHMLVVDRKTGKLIATDQMDVPIIFHGEWSSPSAVSMNGETIVVFPDGYGLLHGLALPEPSADGTPVLIEELWTLDLNPHEFRYDEQGLRHVYTHDVRPPFPGKYPHGWIQDTTVWQSYPEAWIESRKTGKPFEGDWREAPIHYLKFVGRNDPDAAVSPHADGPCEVIGMPVVIDNKVYIGLSRDYNYTGTTDMPEELGSPEGKKRKWRYGRFMCLEFSDLKQAPSVRWEDRHVSMFQCNASVHDGLVYAADLGGFLNCWDADTGEVVYKYDIGASMKERSQMVADGKIYICTDAEELIVLTAGPEPQELSRTKISHYSATPAVADGVIALALPREVLVYEQE